MYSLFGALEKGMLTAIEPEREEIFSSAGAGVSGSEGWGSMVMLILPDWEFMRRRSKRE